MGNDPFEFDKLPRPSPVDEVPEEDGEQEPLEIGVYFGLEDERYHADEALGSTSIINLAKNPPKWQYQRLRPRSHERTEPMIWGSALHCRVLEGKEAYDFRYARVPTAKDYEDVLTTTDSIKDFLRMHGQPLAGRKSDLIARAKQIEECPEFFDEILADWHAARPKHEFLNERQYQEIEDAVSNMTREPILNAVMKAGALIDGAAELSIIYEVDGIRRKARFDYSLPPAGTRSSSLIVDLKSFTTFRRGTLETAAISTVYESAYDVQAACYLEAIGPARKLLAEGRVFGEAPANGFLDQFLNAPEFRWVWVMLRRDTGMIPTLLSIDADSPIIKHAHSIIATALTHYREYVERFGLDELWTPEPRMPRIVQPSDFPSYNRGILHEQPEDR